MELEIKGDSSDSGREGSYIRAMNLCRKAMERGNGIDSKEIVHTLCRPRHTKCTLSRGVLVSNGQLLSPDLAGECSDKSAFLSLHVEAEDGSGWERGCEP